jgi:hypothetical protein
VTPSDKPEFLQIMNGLASVFGGQLTPEALDVWWGAFAGWSLHEFRGAAGSAVTRCKFMPRPADLFDVRRASRPTPGEAWEIAGNGRDALADKAFNIATQGRYFGHIPYDEHQWIQKRFLEVYEQLAEVEDARASAPQLAAPEWMTAQPAQLTFTNADGATVDQYGKRAGVSPEKARQNLTRLRQLLDS